MAKIRVEQQRPSIDDVFTTRPKAARPKPKCSLHAVRQTRGPKGKKFPSIVVWANDGAHARAQWFNHYGLNEQTYRYALEVIVLPDDHELASQALRDVRPSGQATTVDQLMNDAFEDQQQAIGKGGVTVAEAT